MCKYKPSLTKIATSDMVAFLRSADCRFEDYKYWEIDVQIQTFTDKDSNIRHGCFFE